MLMKKTTVALFLSQLIVTLAAFLAQGQEPAFLYAYDAEQQVVVREFDVDGVEPSQLATVNVLFKNSTGKEVQIVKAELGCKCLQAKVSSERIPPGEATMMEFEFRAKAAPHATQEVAQAVLTCSDKNTVVIKLKFHYTKFVGFTSDTILHSFVQDDKPKGSKEELVIPLLVSADINPVDIKVKSSKEIDFIDFVVKEIDGKVFISGVYSGSDLKQESVSGTLQVAASEVKATQSAQFVLERTSRFRFFPEKLTFSRLENGKRTATMMVRIQGKTAAKGIDDVKIKLKDGSPVEIESQQLSQGIYRLICTVPEESKGDSITLDLVQNRAAFSFERPCCFLD